MIKLNSQKKRAVIETDVAGNEVATIKNEDTTMVTNLYVDFINRSVRVIMYRGVIVNNVFTISDPDPVLVDIVDKPETLVHVDGANGPEIRTLPQVNAYTELITPMPNQKRWTGDFRIKDVEDIIKKHNLAKIDIVEIKDQN